MAAGSSRGAAAAAKGCGRVYERERERVARLTPKARNVPQMEFGEGDIGSLRGNAPDVHGLGELEVLLGPLVDDAAGRAPVDPHGEVLLDRDELGHVGLAVRHLLVAVHRRGRIIADVIRDAHATVEQLDGQVLAALPIIKQYSVLLARCKNNRHVCLGPCAKWL